MRGRALAGAALACITFGATARGESFCLGGARAAQAFQLFSEAASRPAATSRRLLAMGMATDAQARDVERLENRGELASAVRAAETLVAAASGTPKRTRDEFLAAIGAACRPGDSISLPESQADIAAQICDTRRTIILMGGFAVCSLVPTRPLR